jgi:hypothetical protein
VVAADDMGAALLEALSTRTAMLTVLFSRHPPGAKLLERELVRLGKIGLESVSPDLALYQRLPRGICRRLLAVPVRSQPPAAHAEIAVADPLDLHARDELVYHLGRPVRLVQTPLSEIFAALEALDALPSGSPTAPGEILLGYEGSEEHTPAVRTSRPPLFGSGPASSAGRLGRPSQGDGSKRGPLPEPGIEPIPLTRTAMVSAAPAPERPTTLEATLRKFETLDAPHEVTKVLLGGLETVAEKAVIFSVRGRRLEGRTAHRALGGDAAVAELGVDVATSQFLEAALEAGHATGRLGDEPPDSTLRSLFGIGTDQVYGARLDVLGRPSLLLVLANMPDAALATEQADRLVRAARTALERILRTKKARS